MGRWGRPVCLTPAVCLTLHPRAGRWGRPGSLTPTACLTLHPASARPRGSQRPVLSTPRPPPHPRRSGQRPHILPCELTLTSCPASRTGRLITARNQHGLSWYCWAGTPAQPSGHPPLLTPGLRTPWAEACAQGGWRGPAGQEGKAFPAGCWRESPPDPPSQPQRPPPQSPRKAAPPCLLVPPPPGVHPSQAQRALPQAGSPPAQSRPAQVCRHRASAGGGPRPRPLSWESLHAGAPGPEQGSGDPTPTVSPGPTRTHSSAAPQRGPAHTARERTGSRPTRQPLPGDALPAGQNGGSRGHWRSRSLGRSRAEVPEVGVSRRFGATLGIPLSHPRPSCPPARPSSVQAERDASQGWTPGQGRGADMQKCPPRRKAGPQPRRG